MSAAPGRAVAPAGESALAARWLAPRLARSASKTAVPSTSSSRAFRWRERARFSRRDPRCGGDLLRGDVEIHLRASGWRSHGHAADPAYAGVVLHVVAANDSGALSTRHANGRAIPLLVLHPAGAQHPFPPPFTPPCALETLRGADPAAPLARLGDRRLRTKAARVAPLIAGAGPARRSTPSSSRRWPGARTGPPSPPSPAASTRRPYRAAGDSRRPRALAITAELKGAAARLSLRRAGLRPMAQPAKRLEATGAVVARLWPASAAGFPAALDPAPSSRAPRARHRPRDRDRARRQRRTAGRPRRQPLGRSHRVLGLRRAPEPRHLREAPPP